MSEDLFKERYLTQRIVLERDFVTRSVAIDRILGREVVITHLNGRIGRRAAVQERFRTAAREAVRLSHANVVALYDIGSANGFPYSVQEHTHSESLTEIIAHEGPFHPDDVAVLVEHVAAALDYAALREVPHLALSPDAITVDYDGHALVADFGIGRVLAEIAPTEVENLRYAAPEMVLGNAADVRSDVFSLGVIAYEMLTGQSPFDTESVDTLRAGILASQPLPLSTVSPGVPEIVSAIVLRALHREPAERFQTAGYFSDALSDWQGGSGTQPIPPDPVFGTGAPQLGSVDVTTPLPAAVLPGTSDAQGPADPEGYIGRRGSAIAAWLGVVIAIGALVWIAASLLDDRDGNLDPGTNRAALSSPTAAEQETATSVTVPTAVSLIGMTLDQASAETDLRVRVVETETSDSVPAGQIIRQSPNPGRPVRTREVIVVVSAGPAAQPIDLSAITVQDMSFATLAEQLINLGLNVSELHESSAAVPDGQVIRIDEQTAQPGDTVHVVVSMGDRVLIPLDVHSQNVDQAAERLTELGLELNDPIGVSEQRIESSGVVLDEYQIVDGDVVGIQEEEAAFGSWVDRGTELTLVYFDASLTE